MSSSLGSADMTSSAIDICVGKSKPIIIIGIMYLPPITVILLYGWLSRFNTLVN